MADSVEIVAGAFGWSIALTADPQIATPGEVAVYLTVVPIGTLLAASITGGREAPSSTSQLAEAGETFEIALTPSALGSLLHTIYKIGEHYDILQLLADLDPQEVLLRDD